ncbi:MAG: hypothetical protein AcusKO_42050 [Acuticoccus sp.]
MSSSEDTSDQPIALAYFPEWGIYERDYRVADVPAENLTHLVYAFTQIELVDGEYQIGLFDEWAAVQYPFSAEQSVDGVADVAGQELMGNFNELAELKEAHPHLSILIGIGGWTLSDNFSDMASTEQGRADFTDSVIQFLQDYPMFDGIDWDWEYPGGGGLADNSVRSEDGEHYALLLEEMREKLDSLEDETGRSYEQSVAAPAGSDKIESFNAEGLAPHVDFFNVMTYDYYGAWQDTTGHLAGMYDQTGAGYDITTTIELYKEAGVDPGQLVLGLPSYARAWTGVQADSPIDAWNAPSSGGAPGTYPNSEPAYYEYKDLLGQFSQADSNWGLYYDDDAQAAFLYDPTTGIFSSIETPETVAIKSEWAQAEGLGGFMFWDLSGDSNGPESLIGAAYASWFEGQTFEEISAASSLEFDEVFGGDGVVAPIAEADTPANPIDDGSDDVDDPDTPDDGDAQGGGGSDDDISDDDAPGDDDAAGDPTPDPVQDGGLGTAGVTAATADVVITYNGSQDLIIDNFDPASSTIYVDWVTASQISATDTDDGILIEVPHLRQTWLLSGVSLSDLSAANFTFLDASAASEILSLVGDQDDVDTPDDGNDGDAPDDGDDPDTPDDGDSDETPDDAGDGSDPVDHGLGEAGVTRSTADVAVTYNGSQNLVIDDFDPASNTIFVDWISADQIDVSDTDDGVLISVPHLRQSWLLTGISLSDLSASNFTFLDASAASEVLSAVGAPVDDGDDNSDGQGNDDSGDDDGAADDDAGDDDDTGDDDGDDGGADDDDAGDDDDTGDDDDEMDHLHVTITPSTVSQTIDGFNPMMDVIEISGGVTGTTFDLFEESGDALGTTVRIAVLSDGGQIISTTIFTDLSLADLDLGNFSIDDQSVLNEVAAALGTSIEIPDTGGYTPVPDTDGSDPAATTGTTDAGGTKYQADTGADDIVWFDPALDELDFGSTSVHSMIVTKTPDGSIAVDSPWSPALQILHDVTYQDVTIDNFGVVGNEHLRQDMSGVVSWEQGIGPAFEPAVAGDPQTVYVRSHEYGVHEVVTDFDAATDKISFLYFGTRERLTVEDTDDGLVISSLPTGQSVTILGVTLAELVPGQVEFHHDQVMEDNLEAAFGFDQNAVTLADRTVLLTPEAPEGQGTDGFQVREGDFGDGAGDIEIPDGDGTATDNGTPYIEVEVPSDGSVDIEWHWAERAFITDFDPSEDTINLGTMGSENFQITAADDGDLVLEVLQNGGQVYRIDGLEAEQAIDVFEAPDWNEAALAAAAEDLESLF